MLVALVIAVTACCLGTVLVAWFALRDHGVEWDREEPQP